jgi:hypothetical protein
MLKFNAYSSSVLLSLCNVAETLNEVFFTLTCGQIVIAGKGMFHTGVGTSAKDTSTGEVFHLTHILNMKWATTAVLMRNEISQNILQHNQIFFHCNIMAQDICRRRTALFLAWTCFEFEVNETEISPCYLQVIKDNMKRRFS